MSAPSPQKIYLPPRLPADESTLRLRVAAHIGASELLDDGRMRCPACAALDFGPTASMEALAHYRDGYLPGAPLLAGVCMSCEHTTSPRHPAAGVELNYYQPTGGKVPITSDGDGWLPAAICSGCGLETIYAVQAMRLYSVALAGVAMKLGGEDGVQLICRNPECTVPDSPVVTHSRPRSYEQGRSPLA